MSESPTSHFAKIIVGGWLEQLGRWQGLFGITLRVPSSPGESVDEDPVGTTTVAGRHQRRSASVWDLRPPTHSNVVLQCSTNIGCSVVLQPCRRVGHRSRILGERYTHRVLAT